ncbi:MAG TPA: L,D-transpeptidase, partial [Actinomycetes bacterium]|nr:L,D-transpeptidase [Actinomycetes bacterium]
TVAVTNSGEFLHAAPWSAPYHGIANVSHGCVGMSTENGKWFYEHSIRGDVVDTVGTSKPMELTNGYGDWNLTWSQWLAGSALG